MKALEHYIRFYLLFWRVPFCLGQVCHEEQLSRDSELASITTPLASTYINPPAQPICAISARQPQRFGHEPPWFENGGVGGSDEETGDSGDPSDDFDRIKDNLNNATYQAVRYMEGLLQSIDSMEMRLSMLETEFDTSTLTTTGMRPTTRSSIQESPMRATSTVLVPLSSAIKPNAEHTSSSTRHPSPTTTLTVKPVTVNGSISMSSYTTVLPYVPPAPIIDSGEATSTTTVTSRSIIIVNASKLSTAPPVFKPTLQPGAAPTVPKAPASPQAISTTARPILIASSGSAVLTHSRTGGWNSTFTSATNIFTTMQWVSSFPFSVTRTGQSIPKNETINSASTITTLPGSTTTVRVTNTISKCLDTDSSSVASSVASSVTTSHDLANATTKYRFTHTRVGIPFSRIHHENSSTTNSFLWTASSSKYLASSVPTTILRSNQTRQRLSKLHNPLTYITTVPNSRSALSTNMSVDTESETTRWVL